MLSVPRQRERARPLTLSVECVPCFVCGFGVDRVWGVKASVCVRVRGRQALFLPVFFQGEGDDGPLQFWRVLPAARNCLAGLSCGYP